MIINTSPLVTDFSWLQEGYAYGISDSGPWQKLKRRGLNTAIEYWANYLENAGWIVTVTREKVSSSTNQGISMLEANCGWAFPYLYGTETPENIWEIDPEDNPKNLLEADFPFSGTSGLNSVNLSSKLTRDAVAKIVQAGTVIWYPAGSANNVGSYGVVHADDVAYLFDDGNYTVPSQAAITTALAANPPNPTASYFSLPSADYAGAYSLYLLMKAGVETFPVEASVIRHSMLTSNLYAVKASYNNMNRLISTASMYSVEGVPTSLFFDVPSQPSPGQFIQFPAAGTFGGDLQYGWRKVRPQVARLSRMRWRVTQNYQFGLWPIITFGAVL